MLSEKRRLERQTIDALFGALKGWVQHHKAHALGKHARQIQIARLSDKPHVHTPHASLLEVCKHDIEQFLA